MNTEDIMNILWKLPCITYIVPKVWGIFALFDAWFPQT